MEAIENPGEEVCQSIVLPLWYHILINRTVAHKRCTGPSPCRPSSAGARGSPVAAGAAAWARRARAGLCAAVGTRQAFCPDHQPCKVRSQLSRAPCVCVSGCSVRSQTRPDALARPAVQAVQASVAPVPAVEKPGEHAQVDAPEALVDPTGQAVHEAAPGVGLKVLAVHAMCIAARCVRSRARKPERCFFLSTYQCMQA
jgi:hypothetical protein